MTLPHVLRIESWNRKVKRWNRIWQWCRCPISVQRKYNELTSHTNINNWCCFRWKVIFSIFLKLLCLACGLYFLFCGCLVFYVTLIITFSLFICFHIKLDRQRQFHIFEQTAPTWEVELFQEAFPKRVYFNQFSICLLWKNWTARFFACAPTKSEITVYVQALCDNKCFPNQLKNSHNIPINFYRNTNYFHFKQIKHDFHFCYCNIWVLFSIFVCVPQRYTKL